MWHGSQIIRQVLLDNSLTDRLAAALAFLLTFTVLPLLRRLLRSRRAHHAERELPMPVALAAHLLERTSRVVLWILALWAAEIRRLAADPVNSARNAGLDKRPSVAPRSETG